MSGFCNSTIKGIKMKKVLLVGAALSLLSTSAMASQARLLSLGMSETDNDGMYHIQDNRNIFLNPAWLNVYNNYVTAEFGKEGTVAGTNAATGTPYTTFDRNDKPKAQGGFFKKHGSLVYGLYLGAESNTSSLLRAAGTSSVAAINFDAANTRADSKMLNSADNQFDLFLAGDNGLKWGANVTFARGKDDSRQASDLAIATRWGVMTDRWDAHLNLSLASKAKATDSGVSFGTTAAPVAYSSYSELKGKLGIQLGGSFLLSGNNRVYGYVKHYSWEQTQNATTALTSGSVIVTPGAANPVGVLGGQEGLVKGDFTSYHLGWGTHYDVNTSDKLYVSFSAKKTDINAKFANKGEVRHLVLPVSLAYEAKATEWLTLRGSVTQSVWSSRDNKNLTSLNIVARNLIAQQFGSQGKGTVANTTDVRAGATLTFGNLEVDGLVGSSNLGQLDGNDLFTRAGLTYKF